MELRGRLYLLVVQQLPQHRLLTVAPFQYEQHAFHGQVVKSHTLVKFGSRERMDVPVECDKIVQVYGLGHQRVNRVGLCQNTHRRQRNENEQQTGSGHQKLQSHEAPPVGGE